MCDKTMPNDAKPASGAGELQLTKLERRLIGNFRAMKPVAQEMLYDLSDQYKRTLPAVPVQSA